MLYIYVLYLGTAYVYRYDRTFIIYVLGNIAALLEGLVRCQFCM